MKADVGEIGFVREFSRRMRQVGRMVHQGRSAEDLDRLADDAESGEPNAVFEIGIVLEGMRAEFTRMACADFAESRRELMREDE